VFIVRKTVQAALRYSTMHPHKQSSHCQDVFDQTHPDSELTAYLDAW